MSAVYTAARGLWVILRDALLEIFDEAGYERYLTRNQVRSSREAWAGFAREQATRKERRARCC